MPPESAEPMVQQFVEKAGHDLAAARLGVELIRPLTNPWTVERRPDPKPHPSDHNSGLKSDRWCVLTTRDSSG